MAKVIGYTAYAHRDYLYTLPGWATRIVAFFDEHGSILNMPREAWEAIKVSRAHISRGKAVPESVSLLLYHDFELVDHPELLMSIKLWAEQVADSTIVKTKLVMFAGRKSPPILHRKELLVDTIHENYGRWAALSEAEEAAGLLNRRGIGTKLAWERLLREKGYKVMFSCLVENDYENDNTSS